MMVLLTLWLTSGVKSQFYAGLDVGAGVILHETNGTVAGHGGYTIQTEHINFYAEVNATYGTRNRGQISLQAGSTGFTPHLVLMGGATLTEEIYMGKYQLETRNAVLPSGTAYYHFRVVDAGGYIVARYAGGFQIGVGVGRLLVK